MQTEQLLAELLDLADRLGIEIRREPLGGDGGALCRLRHKRVLFLDTNASGPDQLAQIASALADQPDLEKYYLLPQVRQVLNEYRDQQ